jgi:hypothetical protein
MKCWVILKNCDSVVPSRQKKSPVLLAPSLFETVRPIKRARRRRDDLSVAGQPLHFLTFLLAVRRTSPEQTVDILPSRTDGMRRTLGHRGVEVLEEGSRF